MNNKPAIFLAVLWLLLTPLCGLSASAPSPTLSAYLGIAPPSGSIGVLLEEVIE